MKCEDCGKEYEKWLPEAAIENNKCLPCNSASWQEWEEEQAEDFARIAEIEAAGHPRHCATRQVWGDGECECDMYAKGYDPHKWASL